MVEDELGLLAIDSDEMRGKLWKMKRMMGRQWLVYDIK